MAGEGHGMAGFGLVWLGVDGQARQSTDGRG